MRLNAPLLPFSIEIQRRSLPKFRFTIAKLMLFVVAAAILSFLVANQRRLGRAMGDYGRQISAEFNFDDLVRFQRMHNEVETAFVRNDFLLFVAIIATVAVIALFVLGRAIDWLLRR